MRVKELYFDSIRYEETTLTYTLYYFLQEKGLSLEDDTSAIDFNETDNEKIARLIQVNPLGIRNMKIFSLKMTEKRFVFIFAYTSADAIRHFRRLFRKNPLNCHEYLLDYEIVRGNEVTSFREMKKEHQKFPALAGFFEKY